MALRKAFGIVKRLIVLALLVAGGLFLYALARDNPEDLPWTELDLTGPVGAFTGQKLARLTEDPAACRAKLDEAGVGFTALPAHRPSPGCGYADGLRPAGGTQRLSFAPDPPLISCPVQAGLALWEWHVVQPVAIELFGQEVARIEHLGGYGCRRLYGESEGRWSEHATADAIDIAAFVLADGTRISVLEDWDGEGEHAAFLRRVRDGGCDLFATVLSPDYNAAHADH
ncbi:MAG: extensin family protein, partial [Sphingomonadales bacterium]|nr:extensin family protein [Sphingomonadales bacterium]